MLRSISKLQKHDLVRGLPSMSYKDDLFCEDYIKRGNKLKICFLAKTLFPL